MPSTVIVTGDNGPGVAVAALTINDVQWFRITEDQMLEIKHNGGRFSHYEIADETTLTLTVSNGNYTLEIAA